MSPFASALYAGIVVHHRLRPRRHRLRYRVFWLLLDLGELDALDRGLRLFSRNRFNALGFHDRDYGDGTGRDLSGQIEARMREAGIAPDGGPIRLLTMPRIFGYAFNPLNIFFCHRQDGGLAAILYEVNNTFGQRHAYLIPVEDAGTTPIRQECAKQFYVSPFMDMTQHYSFSVEPPADHVAVGIETRDAEGLLFTAGLTGTRGDLGDVALARLLLAFPFLTLKVVAGIHWEALLLWLKGVGLRQRPPPPEQPVTFVSPAPVPQPEISRPCPMIATSARADMTSICPADMG